MIKILICLGLILSSNLLIANTVSQYNTSLTPCFKMNEVEQITKQMDEILQQEFCEDKVDPKKFDSISQAILPKIMTESFLGVVPPVNWQLITDEIIKNCMKNKDLCKKQAQKEFAECLKPRIPLILVQFAPWIAENCPELNKNLIKQWPNKKAFLKKTINETKAQE
ncbi:hypothetical protein [Legionella impletisoli]|uniref:Uncharacterized protein n=1 Tax=Legionella impletisoli TaxID=343510 RepID=A0A917JWU2_9GAMM|nr:hypothetical protein [Legionella impletisoli]GGI87938.1 hypothetical protein GCM10007966_15850 [Legionella impletisoli]